MQLTLKKAAALAEALATAGSFESELKIPKYSERDIGEEVAQAEGRAAKGLEDKLKAIEAQFRLRAYIGEANAAQINSLLTQRAMLDAQLKVLRGVKTRKTAPDLDALQREREALRATTREYALYGEGELTVQTLDDAAVQPLLRSLQRERVDVQDQLTTLNFTTNIEIPEDLVSVLRAHDLV